MFLCAVCVSSAPAGIVDMIIGQLLERVLNLVSHS